MPIGPRYQGSRPAAADTANEPAKSTAAPDSQASPTALSFNPRPGTCQAVFQTYWRAFTTPSPVHSRPTRPRTEAARRLSSAVRMASPMRSAVFDDSLRRRLEMTSPARSVDDAAEKNPRTAIPTRSRGRSDRNAERVMADAISPPWSSL
jgi:hypothetical protein